MSKELTLVLPAHNEAGNIERVVASFLDIRDRIDFWRAHMRELYQGLQERWAEDPRPERVLKTDLYDEAISTHNLVTLFAGRCDHFIGTDVSLEIARAAKRRMADSPGGWDSIAVSDARNLAFRSSVFDEIISNSTLDHFSDKRDITESLKELRRIMRPGGTLVVTLDNPWNPVVFLRSRLPYRLLLFFGVIPFYMGATLSKPALVRVLESIGFRVCESTAIAHAPRIFAIRVGRILDRRGSKRISGWFRKLLRLFERPGKVPDEVRDRLLCGREGGQEVTLHVPGRLISSRRAGSGRS